MFFWPSKCYHASGLLVAQTHFRGGSVQSMREDFMLSYSPHTALRLMYQWWTAQLKEGGRPTVMHQMWALICMSFWELNYSCCSAAGESEPDRRLITVPSFIMTTWPLTTVSSQTREDNHCWSAGAALNFGRTVPHSHSISNICPASKADGKESMDGFSSVCLLIMVCTL